MSKLHCAIGLYSQRMRHQRQLYGIYSVFIKVSFFVGITLYVWPRRWKEYNRWFPVYSQISLFNFYLRLFSLMYASYWIWENVGELSLISSTWITSWAVLRFPGISRILNLFIFSYFAKKKIYKTFSKIIPRCYTQIMNWNLLPVKPETPFFYWYF